MLPLDVHPPRPTADQAPVASTLFPAGFVCLSVAAALAFAVHHEELHYLGASRLSPAAAAVAVAVAAVVSAAAAAAGVVAPAHAA